MDLPFGVHAEQPHLLLQERVELLDHDHPLDAGREFAHHPGRDRPDHAQLQEGGVREHLARVLVDDAAGDDPQAAVAPLDAVVRKRLGELGQLADALLDHGAAQARPARGGHELVRVAQHPAGRGVIAPLRLAQLHRRRRVRHAHHGAEDHRLVELLAHLERDADEILGLLAVGRLQHRHLGEPGVVAVVLLVLRAEHARVVGRDDHHARVGPGVDAVHEGVRGHVHAHLLGGEHRPLPRVRRAHHAVHRHLFVDRPLAVDLLVARDVLEDLRAGRAGVAHRHLDAVFVGAACDRLISGEHDLHKLPLQIANV